MRSHEIHRLTPHLGAEVHGLDLRQADVEMAELISSLLLEHKVLFFPEQHLDPAAHVALGRHFGTLDPGHPNLENKSGFPEVFELAASRGGIADEWHSDLTFQDEPSIMSILQMITCPEVGGDTMWTSLSAAYDDLSPPMQELCEGLSALHDADAHNRSDLTAVHPVVRVHPETGERCLFVNEHFTRRIVELSPTESDVLLRHLTSAVADNRFTVRRRWEPGTVAMWDNRCTQHQVQNNFEGERVIQRVTVIGDKVTGVGDAPRWPRWQPGTRAGATSRLDRSLRHHFKTATDVTQR